MPTNNGVYTLPPVYLAVPGTTIQAIQHNSPFEDVATAINTTIMRDGSRPPTANIPMNGNKITGLGTATAPADAVRLDQVPVIGPYQSAVASLTVSADQVPYATGPSTAAMTSLTAFGRSVIASSDAAAGRSLLGLGAGAIAPTQTQTTWSDGTSATESIISPAKLHESVIQYMPTQSYEMTGIVTAWRKNTSNKFWFVCIAGRSSSSSSVAIELSHDDGATSVGVGQSPTSSAGDAIRTGGSFILPPGASYRASSSLSIQHWTEIR